VTKKNTGCFLCGASDASWVAQFREFACTDCVPEDVRDDELIVVMVSDEKKK
jgi:hypothetical protein